MIARCRASTITDSPPWMSTFLWMTPVQPVSSAIPTSIVTGRAVASTPRSIIDISSLNF